MRDTEWYADMVRRNGALRANVRPELGAAAIAPALFWTGPVPLDVTAPTGGDPVYAVANHGRWIAECSDCHGAQLTSAADPRFLCDDCGNVANAGQYRPVMWPANHRDIEVVLDERTEQKLRNWSPGEELDALREENEQPGVTR